MTKWGDVKSSVLKPFLDNNSFRTVAVEVLPFVPTIETDLWLNSCFSSREKNLVVFQHQNFKFGLVPGEYIDIEVEKKKLNKKLAELSKTLDVSKSRLDNKKFVENAKPELIQQEKKNLANVTLEIDTINETLNTLNG